MKYILTSEVPEAKAAIVNRPRGSNPYCGDQGDYWQRGNITTLCMADGLGHGLEAEKAAKMALNFVSGHLLMPLITLFQDCDKALASTRGAAIAIGVVDEEKGTLTFAAINNIHALIFGESTTRLSAHNGIVGGGFNTLVPETVPVCPGDIVLFHTDGLKEGVDLGVYGDELRADPQQLAERILQDHALETDDAGVLIFKCG